MIRLPLGAHGALWAEFLQSLLHDLEPLGFSVSNCGDYLSVNVSVPTDVIAAQAFWDIAHRRQHDGLLAEQEAAIGEFEANHPDVFVRTDLFQPSAIQPTLEMVDFADSRHRGIVDYLAASQSVTSRRRVGRRMGLLVWDDGQTGHRPLIGAAVLASARYSQRLRDGHLGWRTHYPKTSVHFDEHAKSIREAGLARMMQLSIACAMRPYDVLSGAWLIAAAPFTEIGQLAFERACKKQDDPDLAAVVTTTGKGPSGFPFRNHRVVQLSGRRFTADAGANGNLYTHIHPTSESDTLFASFEGLLSAKTVDLACTLLQNERPDRFATAKDVQRYAITYGLQRTGHSRRLFHGNEMGVHIGMLGSETRDHLTQGTPRRDRPRLNWDDLVKIWTGKFLPPADGSQETATANTKSDHAQARRKRLARAHKYPQEQVPLSFYIPLPAANPSVPVGDLEL